jgi:hypothetical protein
MKPSASCPNRGGYWQRWMRNPACKGARHPFPRPAPTLTSDQHVGGLDEIRQLPTLN